MGISNQTIEALLILFALMLALGVYSIVLTLSWGVMNLAYSEYMRDRELFDLASLVGCLLILVGLIAMPLLCILDYLLK